MAEFDISDIAWKVYELMYRDCVSFSDNQDKIRRAIKSEFRYKNNKSAVICFSGETDFNYSRGFAWSRLDSKALNNKEIPPEYQIMYGNNFYILQQLMYSIINISLMPQTGNMQATKQGIGNDRLDTYIWALNEYYTGKSNIIMNHCSFDNVESLQSFLDIFIDNEDKDNSIYQYCEAVYHISESLVDDLIESGKLPLNTHFRIMDYMKLTIRFWMQKMKYINKQIEGKQSNEYREIQEELNRINNLMAGLFSQPVPAE